MTKTLNAYHKILDTAETLTQTRGFNAFSYKDIADIVGIKTSSIHYYFPTKADLGKEIVKKHIDELCAQLDEVMKNKTLSSRKKLELFIDGIVAKTYLSERKMCLGGMLASDVLTLPDIMQHEVRMFFNRLEDWIKTLLAEGLAKKEFHIEKKNLRTEAQLILSLLEGSLLLARLFQDDGHLKMARKSILARLNSSK